MKKKSIVASVVFVCSVMVLGTAVWAAQKTTIWDNFKKISGVVKVQNGVLSKIPGEKEKNAVVQSIDPATGMPTRKLEDFIIESTETVRIPAKLNGEDKEFNFHVQYNGDKPVLISHHDQPYVLTEWPNSETTIMEYNENLYVVDVKEKRITPLLSDHVGQYSLKALEKESIEGHVPTWGTNASVSPDGKWIVFHSTRNVIYDGNAGGYLWVKDTETGIEEPILEGGYPIIGWGNDEFFIHHSDSVKSVNIKTKETKVIADFALRAAVAYPYMVIQEDYGKLSVINLETFESKDISFESLYRVAVMRTFNGSPWVLLLNAPEISQRDRTIALINMETHEVKQLNAPENTYIKGVQWIDGEQFLVNVNVKGSDVEETYIVPVDDVN